MNDAHTARCRGLLSGQPTSKAAGSLPEDNSGNFVVSHAAGAAGVPGCMISQNMM